jgi:putative hydrolase of HD superfamily
MDVRRYIPEADFSNEEFDAAAEVVQGLYEVERSGWVKRNVDNPETVGQHVDSLVLLVEEFTEQIKDELDVNKVKRMLQIHDWPEYIEGDPILASLEGEELVNAKKKKREGEELAMKAICAKLGEQGPVNLALWYEFEEGITPESKFSMQLDKLQAMLKAWEYEKDGQNGSAKEFIEHAEDGIVHPVLKEKLEALKREVYNT